MYAPLCVGFPRCGRGARGRWLCGCGGRRFLFGLGALRGVASPHYRVWRRCGCWAMCFRLRAGVAAKPCAFRWLAPGPRTKLRLQRKKASEKGCSMAACKGSRERGPGSGPACSLRGMTRTSTRGPASRARPCSRCRRTRPSQPPQPAPLGRYGRPEKQCILYVVCISKGSFVYT